MRTTLRAVAALAVSSVLSLTLLPTEPASAVPNPADPGGSITAVTWINSQLTAGLIHNDQFDFDDLGLSIDTALALQALHDLGGQATTGTVSTISAAVSTHIGDYVGDGTVESYAGALAKAATLAQVTGADATSFGGVNLIARLEARVLSGGPTDGRIKDASAFGDFANTIGQSFAVEALNGASSAKAASAQAFLLQQQCPAGWFRLSFSAEAASGQGCDPASDTADTDTTAFAVLALKAHLPASPADPAVLAYNKAVAWLQATQKTDGSWGGSGPTAASNANSTGLAGWALQSNMSAGTWLREHQLTNLGACQPYRAVDAGAVAYDDAALAAAGGGITTTKQDQFRRATAQALPALLWSLPDTGGAQVPPPNRSFVRSGETFDAAVAAGTPGTVACAAMPGRPPVSTRLNRSGAGTLHLTWPATSGPATVTVSSLAFTGVTRTTTFDVYALAPKELSVDVGSKRVHRGDAERVKVTDLAPGESVQVFLGHDRVAKGKANAHGVFKDSFVVKGKLGKAKIKVTGQYDDIRYGTTKIRVRP